MESVGGGRARPLPVGSIVELASAIAAIAFRNGMPTPITVLLAVLGGFVLSGISGLGVTYLKIPSLIMTIDIAATLARRR